MVTSGGLKLCVLASTRVVLVEAGATGSTGQDLFVAYPCYCLTAGAGMLPGVLDDATMC